MTPEFEMLKHDPDLQAERGPGGTLIFLDGDQYCVVGPEFVSVEESDCLRLRPHQGTSDRQLRSKTTSVIARCHETQIAGLALSS